ncbi:hypothetical protein T552_00594 [Pneumocystis carinii B80]|uniref:Pre-mRNA-splicing factor n=1 Tax=Pneumocystis carinii (strain B80) TaxID=1408658 RepID=A0A0W4ZP15_PNEC8|nr:hypothetical protein T552_00594 [Pneumocystis carinii B80]KTW30116.1 hypothetical protein T552_00594 [Pneumocystis carinii B80]
MNKSPEPISLSFQPTKIAPKWGNSKSLTYTKKKIFKNNSDEEEEIIEDELLSGFDDSGALSLNPERSSKKEPLVIPALKNRDWRQEVLKYREKKLYLANEEYLQNGGVISQEKDLKTYGLTFIDKEKENPSEKISQEVSNTSTSCLFNAKDTEEECAIKALLAEAEGQKTESNLVLPMTSNTDWKTNARNLTEDELYKRDIMCLPDPATLEDYENIPVEEFGNALLRGMGWKEGEGIGKNKQETKMPNRMVRRAQFLGIGAKEYDSKEQDELGAWGKGITKKQADKTYVPVLKINKATGEIIHEEPTRNRSKETYEKNTTFKESQEKFKSISTKRSNNYSFKGNESGNSYKGRTEDSYHSSYSISRKNSDDYRHHHSGRDKNQYYNTYKDKH